METLKKITTICFLLIAFNKGLYAQNFPEMQKAFASSITAEAKGNYTDAIQTLNPVYNEKDYACNLRLGWLYYLTQNYTKAENYYRMAVSIKPYSIEAKLGYVKALSMLESWDMVLKQYDDILKIDSQNYTANYWSAVIQYNRKKYDLAAKSLEKLVNLFPFDYDANHMLAWTYFFQGKKNEAKLLFQQALLIRPADPSAADGLSKC